MVRSTAAEVLGELGDRRATAGLKAALDDSDSSVWQAASDALAQLYRKDVGRLLPLLRSSDTVNIYYGLIGLGKKGTADELITALDTYGYETMAEDYLNSGNAKLDAAARRWADAHGYYITTLPGFGGTGGWGRLG
jgi:HEAT repeat protein